MLARLFLATTGWKPWGTRPEPNQYVLIAAPHTTNWDFPYLIAFAEYFEIKISWMGKHTLFNPPFGWFMRGLGGLPVQRHKRGNLVESLVALFDEYDELGLVVPAEGTRSRVEHWKSGFYHIARNADVPIIMGFLDHDRKLGGFGPAFHTTGDVSEDMDQIRAFYSDKLGKFPELFGPVRLVEEKESEEAVSAPSSD